MLGKMNLNMYCSKDKNEIRETIVDSAIKYGCKHMLTMAGERGVDAKMFSERLRSARIVSVEEDADVFEFQQKELLQFRNTTCLNVKLSDFLNSGISMFSPFDCVFFDYYCLYKKQVEHDVESLFSCGRFARDGVFAITLAKAHERPEFLKGTRLLSGVCCNNYHDYVSNKEGCIDTTMHQIARDHGINLKQIMQKSYRNTKTGSSVGATTMMVFIYKTTNRKGKR